jgi:hypothetical protein
MQKRKGVVDEHLVMIFMIRLRSNEIPRYLI